MAGDARGRPAAPGRGAGTAGTAGADAPLTVAVLMGGVSAERDVSLSSGVQVAAALREAGLRAVAVDTAAGPLARAEEAGLMEAGVPVEEPGPEAAGRLSISRLMEVLETPEVREADVAFVALHGGAGEDGTVQAVLDLVGLPYAGSGHLGCALAMDKDVSKRLFRDAGIPTAEWRAGPAVEETAVELGYPMVVKPASGGSTVGLTVVREPAELGPAVRRARRYGPDVLAEAYVRGREITVGVLDGEALPVGEIIPEHEIFDYACKYQAGMAREIFPADLPDRTAREVQELALRAHRALKLGGFSRIDFILDGEETPWCLEANALPGMTPTSLVPQAAEAAGIPFPELCRRIVEGALAARRPAT